MGTGSHPLDYLIFVFVACLGALQIAAGNTGLLGLSFFRSRLAKYFVGIVLVAGAFVWFFGSERRIGHDIVAGAQQYGLFTAGIAAGIVATLVLSSIINSRREKGACKEQVPEEGLEALENRTYFRIVADLLGGKRER